MIKGGVEDETTVSWTEDRGLHSPQPMGRARVECRIMQEKDTGVLLFVAKGSVRYGKFFDALPWESLLDFHAEPAEKLYTSPAGMALKQILSEKSKISAMALVDHAQVILASFKDGQQIHVNCAEAAPVEIANLIRVLKAQFIEQRQGLVDKLCGGRFVVPPEKRGAVPVYDPSVNEAIEAANRRNNRIANVLVGVVLLGLGAGFLWLVGVIKV